MGVSPVKGTLFFKTAEHEVSRRSTSLISVPSFQLINSVSRPKQKKNNYAFYRAETKNNITHLRGGFFIPVFPGIFQKVLISSKIHNGLKILFGGEERSAGGMTPRNIFWRAVHINVAGYGRYGQKYPISAIIEYMRVGFDNHPGIRIWIVDSSS